jgi:hypothetical protein
MDSVQPNLYFALRSNGKNVSDIEIKNLSLQPPWVQCGVSADIGSQYHIYYDRS